MSNAMIARAPGSTMDPPEVEARSDTREIPLATIDERSPSANYAGSQDTSSDNTNINTRRSPVPPQANILTLERTQRSSEAAQFVTPSSSSNIIPDNSNRTENISKDTSSENANIYTRRSPVPPKVNHLVLERTQRAREATTNVAPSSSSNIILENIPKNTSNSNMSQNSAASLALTRNRTEYDVHRNNLSTIAIDTGTNRVIERNMTMQSAPSSLSHNRFLQISGIIGLGAVIIANISSVNVPPIASSVRSRILIGCGALLLIILASTELRGVFQRSTTPEEMVRHVLKVVGFTSNEATSLMSNLNIDGLDRLVMVTTDAISSQVRRLRIDECRHHNLRHGIEIFQNHYMSHDKPMSNASQGVYNSFNYTMYTPAFHRRISHVHMMPPSNPSFAKNATISSSELTQSHQSHNTNFANANAVEGEGGDDDGEDDKSNDEDGSPSTPPPILRKNKVKSTKRKGGAGNGRGSSGRNGGSNRSSGGDGGDGDDSDDDSDDSDGNSDDSSTNDSDYNSKDNASSNVNSPEDDGEEDTDSDLDIDDDFPYTTSKGGRHMNPTNNLMPAIPVSKKDSTTYLVKARTEFNGINAEALVRDSNRIGLPTFDPGIKTGKKLRKAKKKYRKKVKQWKEQDLNILHYLQTTAIAADHTLRDQICAINGGVEAYDYVKRSLDPVKYDKVSAGAEAIDNFNNLKLTSTQKGAWLKFRATWEECIRDLKEIGNPLGTHDESLKESLMTKLPFEKYNWVHVTPFVFENTDGSTMTITEALNTVQFYAIKVEHAESIKNEKSSEAIAHVNNVNTDKTESNKAIPDTIGGYAVNKRGYMNSDMWAELTEDEKDKFFVARKKLISDGTIDQDEAGCQVAPSKDTTTETSSDEQIIADLRKELKELEKNSETKFKSSIANAISDMTVDQAISGLNRINQVKVLKFIQAKSNTDINHSA